jgi:hypothetical protein
MKLKEVSIINKLLLGLLGLGIVINIYHGAVAVYYAFTNYFSFDYEQSIVEYENDKVNLLDAVLSINLVTLTTIFIINCFMAYLYFKGKKLFIPLFILSNIFITVITFILNVIANLGEYEGFKDTIIALIATIFWTIYLICSKQMKILFPNEMKFQKRYVKITVEEYETLKNIKE